MEYAAYDKVGADARGGGWLPFSDVAQAGAGSEAPTMPGSASSKAPVGDGPPSLPWCVDRGASLEAMSTVALWSALEAGDLPAETRVWREGMECWTPASQVRELRWTVARLSAPPEAAEDRGAGALVSAGLTPDELGLVQQWVKASASLTPEPPPESTRERRSELPTLMSTPEPSDPGRLSPISLELPMSFPRAPGSPASGEPALPLMCAEAAPAEACAPASTEAAGAEDPPRQAPSGTRPRLGQRLADRLGRRREALYVAAGFAVATLSIATALAETAAPPPARLVAGLEAAIGAEVAALPPAGAPAAHRAATMTSGGQCCRERGQHRLRRGHGSPGARADATSAQRAESR